MNGEFEMTSSRVAGTRPGLPDMGKVASCLRALQLPIEHIEEETVHGFEVLIESRHASLPVLLNIRLAILIGVDIRTTGGREDSQSLPEGAHPLGSFFAGGRQGLDFLSVYLVSTGKADVMHFVRDGVVELL